MVGKKLREYAYFIMKAYRAESTAKIHAGPFNTRGDPHQPLTADMEVYDHARYYKDGSNQSNNKEKLLGTRFSKSRSQREPWRPNNPAKKGHNKTLNKMSYYHQTLYYRPQEQTKFHDEKVWMYVYHLIQT